MGDAVKIALSAPAQCHGSGSCLWLPGRQEARWQPLPAPQGRKLQGAQLPASAGGTMTVVRSHTGAFNPGKWQRMLGSL